MGLCMRQASFFLQTQFTGGSCWRTVGTVAGPDSFHRWNAGELLGQHCAVR